MPSSSTLRSTRVRLATPGDFEAIHSLNYRTFVEEIPQHSPNIERRLVDRFHDDNTYAVAEVAGRIVGMVCGRTTRPFSLDEKLGSIDDYLPAGRVPVEIRLLAVEPAHRSTRAFTSLVQFITQHFLTLGANLGVISGTTRQERLYRHLGFVPFGPIIGTADAPYQPMYVCAERVLAWPSSMSVEQTVAGNFLPGPVDVRASVREAMQRTAISHRSAAFHTMYTRVQNALCALAEAEHATVLIGSGTHANDMVGAQLSVLGGHGVVVSDGEFGERLADHANRWQLRHTVVRAPWGTCINSEDIARAVRETSATWVWAVHCETSTGVVHDLDGFRELARTHHVRIALDAVSSLGAVPVSMRGIWMASGVSGKALAAMPGLCMVFHDGSAQPAPTRLPRCLDLGEAIAQNGVPFTHSSNLLDALDTALRDTNWPERMTRIARDGRALRETLTTLPCRIITRSANASPAVLTLSLDDPLESQRVGQALRVRGCLVSYESGYLRDRNWLQVCLMGEYTSQSLAHLVWSLGAVLSEARGSVADHVPKTTRKPQLA